MKCPEISTFVDRLESGHVAPEELRGLTTNDWEAIRGFLETRRRVHLQKYVNALYVLRMKADPDWATQRTCTYTYSEREILSEFGDQG